MSATLKRCRTCCRLLPRSAFAINRHLTDGLQSQCRPCISDQYRTGNEPHRIGRETDPVIVAGIRARVLARTARRQGRQAMKTLERAFVRCCLPSLPDDARVIGLRHRAVPCGALLFAGDEVFHIEDVHGLTRVEPGMFTAVEDREEECA
ncbi:MAG: hypothetical protein ACEQSX_12545 [Baekduiaceae bacterium]